jgi:P27 family predicted phage terminase small subunit
VCPAWFDKIAAAEWARIVPELAAAGVLSMVDGAALEGYCSNYSLAVRYQRLANKALTVRTRFGTREPNSAAAAARRHWTLARQFATEFGLTPIARTRISMPTQSKEERRRLHEQWLFGNKEEQAAACRRAVAS